MFGFGFGRCAVVSCLVQSLVCACADFGPFAGVVVSCVLKFSFWESAQLIESPTLMGSDTRWMGPCAGCC